MTQAHGGGTEEEIEKAVAASEAIGRAEPPPPANASASEPAIAGVGPIASSGTEGALSPYPEETTTIPAEPSVIPKVKGKRRSKSTSKVQGMLAEAITVLCANLLHREVGAEQRKSISEMWGDYFQMIGLDFETDGETVFKVNRKLILLAYPMLILATLFVAPEKSKVTEEQTTAPAPPFPQFNTEPVNNEVKQ